MPEIKIKINAISAHLTHDLHYTYQKPEVINELRQTVTHLFDNIFPNQDTPSPDFDSVLSSANKLLKPDSDWLIDFIKSAHEEYLAQDPAKQNELKQFANEQLEIEFKKFKHDLKKPEEVSYTCNEILKALNYKTTIDVSNHNIVMHLGPASEQTCDKEIFNIDAVISEVKERFANNTLKDGYTTNNEFKVIADQTLRQVRWPKASFPQYYDDFFPAYDANRIEGTNFIAMHGPEEYMRTETHVANFIKSIAFNDKIEIHDVVALGSELGIPYSYAYQDFVDYCSGECSSKYHNTNEEATKYEVEIKPSRLNGQVYELLSHQNCPLGIVTSSVEVLYKPEGQKVEKNQLNVTVFQLRDNQSINLTKERKYKHFGKQQGTNLAACKEQLWKIFEASLTKTIVVHCASGVGRTGHFILMLELLKFHHEIFSNKTPQQSADLITSIVNRLRKNRPALIATEEQLIDAISNAHILYQYGLQKRYIQQNMPVLDAMQLKNENEALKDVLAKQKLQIVKDEADAEVSRTLGHEQPLSSSRVAYRF